jgi:hypothetical protein
VASLRLEDSRPPGLPEIVRGAGDAVQALGAALASDEADDLEAARAAAVRVADAATQALDPRWGLSSQVMLAQVRAVAADLLLAGGVPEDDVLRVLPDLPRRAAAR